jgi:hypothetical protein
MKHNSHLIVLGIVVLIAVAGFFIVQKQATTGMVAPGTPVSQKPMLSGAPAEYWREIELQDHIAGFFNTDNFVFPQNSCGKIAEELCDMISKIKTKGMEEISAGNNKGFKTIVFKEYNEIGKITLIKGFKTPESARYHSTTRKMVMTIDGWKEIMDLDMDLEGYLTGNKLVFDKGKIKILEFECTFG